MSFLDCQSQQLGLNRLISRVLLMHLFNNFRTMILKAIIQLLRQSLLLLDGQQDRQQLILLVDLCSVNPHHGSITMLARVEDIVWA